MTIDTLTVINLDRTPERFERFLSNNPGLPVTRFGAIDGRNLSRSYCIEQGLITPSNAYERACVGQLASHAILWERCVTENRCQHVAEDDALLRRDFVERAGASLASVPNFDFVLWAWNFDWPLKLRMAPGLGTSVFNADQEELRQQWPDFLEVRTRPLLARLISAAGLCCYSVSPKGAEKLLDLVLPVAGVPAEYAARPHTPWLNSELSVELSRHYAKLEAYVALPSLAATLNKPEDSTVQDS